MNMSYNKPNFACGILTTEPPRCPIPSAKINKNIADFFYDAQQPWWHAVVKAKYTKAINLIQ